VLTTANTDLAIAAVYVAVWLAPRAGRMVKYVAAERRGEHDKEGPGTNQQYY
jgi:hypothetical protein